MSRTLDQAIDLRDEAPLANPSDDIPRQPTGSIAARATLAVARELRHPAAFLFPLRLFLGIGWLRAFAEKIVSAEWFNGQAVADFLDGKVSADAVAFPVYRQLIEQVIRPGSRWIGWVVMALQLFVGLGILLGIHTNLAILMGTALNANFMLAGQISPSAFYIMIQTVLFVTGAGAILGLDGSRARSKGRIRSILVVAQPYGSRATIGDKAAVAGLAVLSGAMSWLGFAHATDWSPNGVFDPALVFGTVMGLTALSLVILLLRLSDPASQIARHPSRSDLLVD